MKEPIQYQSYGLRSLLTGFFLQRFTQKTIDLVSAIIMGLATTLSAWSGYSAEQWYTVDSLTLIEANAAARDSLRFALIANQKTLLDATMFMQYFEAISRKDVFQANFLAKRFRPEFAAVFEEWMKTNPLRDPKAPNSPFELPQYKVKERVESGEKASLAADLIIKSKEAKTNGRAYSFIAVLFTISIFLSGISPKMGSLNIKRFVLSLSVLVLAIALTRLFALPRAPLPVSV